MANDTMKIQVSLAEAGGLLEYIEHKWYQLQDELGGWITPETKARMEEMMAMLELHSALCGTGDNGRGVAAPRELLETLLREGDEYGREVLGSVLSRDYGDDEEATRVRVMTSKGLMTLADREGLYVGVMV